MFEQINQILEKVNLPRARTLVDSTIGFYNQKRYAEVFDGSKALIECCCVTILKDLHVQISNDDNFQKLIRLTIENLALLPDSHKANPELRKSIVKTVSGFVTIAQGIGELRNSEGIMAHGGDGSYQSLGESYASLMIKLSDAMSTFLLGRHNQFSIERSYKLEFIQDDGFDDYIDESHETFQVFESNYSASDILFSVDPQGYQAYLSNFIQEKKNE